VTDFLQTLITAISAGSVYALAATGIALIFGVMRLMNFAHGEVIMVGGYILLVVADAPWPVIVVASLGVAAIVAMAIERIAYRPIRDASGETLLITSFAVAAVIQNLVILIIGSRPKSVSVLPGLQGNVEVAGLTIGKIDVATIGATALAFVGLAVLLNRTQIGILLRASSENFTMARLLGVRANRVILVAFAVSGLLAGMVSVLLVARTGQLFPQIGLVPLIFAFVATVVGGMGRVGGAIAGGFLLGGMQVILQETLPDSVRPYRDAFLFSLVILVLLFRPQGLFPSRTYDVNRA